MILPSWIRIWFFSAALFSGAFVALSLDTNFPSASGIQIGTYKNGVRSLTLITTEAQVRAVVVPSIGGRVLSYSLDGENIFYHNGTGDSAMGGYQCDIGPELAELPAHPVLWMGVNSWQYKPYSVKVISDPDPVLGLQLTKEFLIDPDNGELALLQRMHNISTNDVSYCLWDRTRCKGGGFAFFPLNKSSRFKKGWTVHSQLNGSFVFDGEKYVSEEVRIMDGVLVASAKGESTKVAADSDAEWVAYVLDDLLYVKYFPYFPNNTYSDGGNSVEVYFDQEVAELQVLSPEVRLAPGQNYSFPEKWMLVRLKDPVKTHEQARKLVKKIPPSPFKGRL